MSAAVAVRSFRLVLSVPPSVNHLFVNAASGGRVKSAAYKAWIEAEGYGQSWERLSEDAGNGIRWRTTIVAYGLPPERDVDNVVKPVLDLICAMTGLRDNWPHRRVVAELADDEVAGEPWLVVTVEVLGETAAPPSRRVGARATGKGRRR